MVSQGFSSGAFGSLRDLLSPTQQPATNSMYIDPEWASQNPDKAQAAVTDAQWENFQTRYRPIEDAAIAEFLRSPEEAAQRAGLAAASGFEGNDAMLQRQLSRHGATMTADQQRVAARREGLNALRGQASAENLTRRNIRDRNIEGLGTMMGIGQGISGGVNRDLGSAAGMQSARNQAGAAAQQGWTNNLIGAGLGLAAMAGF
jgi:hypothetical protein